MRLIIFISSLFLLLTCCNSVICKASGPDNNDHSIVKKILNPINKARSKGRMCGNKYYKAVSPIIWSDLLGRVSLQHSIDMAQNHILSHTGSDGSNSCKKLEKSGYRWIHCGENIGYGYQTFQEAVDSWMDSEMHCKNIMNPSFKEMGAAYSRSDNLRKYWTAVFGTPR
jgi:uncharacterized protein YkwD